LRLRAALAALAGLVCLAAANADPADPADRLSNAAQESRARTMFREIRCLVCQSESIDDSEAPLAHDLRQSVRQQIASGRSEAQVRAYLVQRYGEFILLKPRFSPGNAILWLTPFAIVIVIGGALAWRARRAGSGAAELSEDEEVRLSRLTDV
jgi:cytochrome c-type biogenesis protein CcmH